MAICYDIIDYTTVRLCVCALIQCSVEGMRDVNTYRLTLSDNNICMGFNIPQIQDYMAVGILFSDKLL